MTQLSSLAVNGATIGSNALSVLGPSLMDRETTGPVLSIVNPNPSYLLFTETGFAQKGSVGALGAFEMNVSMNMDYADGVHRYYDSTHAALWLAISDTITKFQYAPCCSTPDIWNNTGNHVPWQLENVTGITTQEGGAIFGKTYGGGVSINTGVSPPNALDVHGLIRVTGNETLPTTGKGTYINYDGTNSYIYTYDRDATTLHNVYIGGGNQFTVLGTGDVGVGTQSPTTLLHVSVGSSGATPNSSATETIESPNDQSLQFLAPASRVQSILFGEPGTANRFLISAGGSATGASNVFKLQTPTTFQFSGGDAHFGTSSISTVTLVASTGAASATPGTGTQIAAEANGDAGISLVFPNANTGTLFFSDAASSTAGSIKYTGSTNAAPNVMTFNTSSKFNFTGGNVGIAVASPGAALTLASTGVLGFDSSGVKAGFSYDSGAVIDVGNGTAGDRTGGLIAATFTATGVVRANAGFNVNGTPGVTGATCTHWTGGMCDTL